MTSTEPNPAAFDPESLRDKYRAERDKRIRSDGNEQYTEVEGAFARYVDDPYIDTAIDRAPRTDEVEVLVVGGGFGGLLVAARLKQAGINDICVVEKGGDFGGTWYWNRYPGAMCDVESYVYMPLLEELDYVPSEKYVHAREILDHCAAIARPLRPLHERMLANRGDGNALGRRRRPLDCRNQSGRRATGPVRCDGERAAAPTEAARRRRHRVVRRPLFPYEPVGDYAYTGGNPDGELDRIGEKRIAIIGTGATAVQCVPHLGAGAQQLYVFQRTPSSIDVRDNRDTDPSWVAELEEGWQKERMDNFNALVSGVPQAVDLVDDGWTDIIGKLMVRMRQGSADLSPDGLATAVELADFEKMEEIRARVDAVVADDDAAEALKPYYRQFCKRPCFHDDYLHTFNRPNVALVDTDGRGIDRITRTGIVANGTEYDVDCIVYATGFEVGTGYARRAGYEVEVEGRSGQTLTEKWSDGVETLHGMMSNDFPNCFIISQTQGGFTVSYPHMLNELAVHVAYLIAEASARDATTIEVTVEAEQSWVKTIIDKAREVGSFFTDCTPGYYNNEGKPGERTAQNGSYGGGSIAFFKLLEDWRASGDLPGVTMR